MRQKYKSINFRKHNLAMLMVVNQIVDEYQAMGLVLSARQLYYQLVAREVIPNNLKSYKHVTNLVNDGKLAGIVDWDMFEDRTRTFRGNQHWNSPGELLRSCASQYEEDRWDTQENRVFAIVEKDALFGVLQGICGNWDIPLMAAKGYPSSSAVRTFVEDLVLPNAGQSIHILHLGDHDPSGVDMTRDLIERIELFCDNEAEVSVHRLALNYAQIEELKPPRNPVKQSDSRWEEYAAKFGQSCWELDAIEPRALSGLVDSAVKQLVDLEEWEKRAKQIEASRAKLLVVSEQFDSNNE